MTSLLFITMLTVIVSVTTGSQDVSTYQLSSDSSSSFISQCVDLANLGIGLQCSGTVCKGEEETSISLEQLQVVECEENTDCMADHTQMECVKGRCACPHYFAFNVTSCSCQLAAQCSQEKEEQEEEEECVEHNGRKCEDRYCSCYSSTDYTSLLVDPSSLFCVLPTDQPYTLVPRGAGAGSLGLAVLGALLGFVSVVLLAVLIVVAYKHCTCEKGDYHCESAQDIPEHHIAAWDHPSLDYVNRGEEDIVFTLCQASDMVRMSNASTIYVMDDETTAYNLTDHDNMGYVEEEDPRHD